MSTAWSAERQEVEYAVLSAVLSEAFKSKCEPLALVTPSLEPESGTGFGGEAHLERVLSYRPISGLESETRESYLAGVHAPVKFDRKFNLAVDYKVVRQNYSKADMPCGYVRLSRPGLNRSGTQALVFGEYHCGAACGWGTFFLLEKKQGAWSVKEKRVAWIG